MKLKDLTEDRSAILTKWKQLVNMTSKELETFIITQEKLAKDDPAQHPGLTRTVARKLKISSGVQSADWILKMKAIVPEKWTPLMWDWAKKQNSFIARMKGARGPLLDSDGNETRKTLSLKIWGHDPFKDRSS